MLRPSDGTAMGNDSTPTDDLRLFQTGGHACGYWPERSARDLVLDPRDPRLPDIYPQALDWGFRRSGDLVYRPHCEQCRACVAVRIPVAAFEPDRSQRRCLARNADIQTRIAPARRTAEHFELYQRYLAARHRDGGMDGHGTVEFDQFLVGSWSETRFVEMRLAGDHGPGRLLAVSSLKAPRGRSISTTAPGSISSCSQHELTPAGTSRDGAASRFTVIRYVPSSRGDEETV